MTQTSLSVDKKSKTRPQKIEQFADFFLYTTISFLNVKNWEDKKNIFFFQILLRKKMHTILTKLISAE